MSKIQITELQEANSNLSLLGDRETNSVVGGYGEYGRAIRNEFIGNFNFSNIVQINNNINVQLAFNGDNFNIANLNNNAGVDQG